MAFFNLTDIQIKSPRRNFRAESKFDTTVLRYPLDIGSLDKGHYMIIHINEQIKTSYASVSGDNGIGNNGTPTIIQNQQNNGTATGLTTIAPNIIGLGRDIGNSDPVRQLTEVTGQVAGIAGSKVDTITNEFAKKAIEATTRGAQVIGKSFSETATDFFSLTNSKQGLRTIQRTADSIALYMPDTLNFSSSQQYSTMEFGSSPLANINAAVAGYSAIKNSPAGTDIKAAAVSNFTPFIVNQFAQKLLGSSAAGVFAAASGTVLNPQLEMIYSSPSFREFRFDFMLYPRSSKEALEVQKILNRLRFHQAPELYKGTGSLGGFFLIPPSEFDIEFYYNGRINPNIPKISTCVLTSIDTDYAPNGWAAYEVPDDVGRPKAGGTGMPVGIRLSLNFQETEIMTKDNYKDAYVNPAFDLFNTGEPAGSELINFNNNVG